MSARIAMIAAVARNGVIGAGQAIPWRIRSDQAYFRRTTMGKPMVMGRKQYESVGRPLPGRTNIVVTRNPGFAPDGVIVIGDLDAALARAVEIADADGVDEAMVIGGGEIYRQAMGRADRLYISHVALAPGGDVVFPAIDPHVWQLAETPEVEPDPRDDATFCVKVYTRR